jgi:adenosylcobinamide-GDP ribazoletransferase
MSSTGGFEMRRQLDLFLCAVQFLTRLPVPASPRFEMTWITRSARYYSLVGQGVGLIGAVALLLAHLFWTGAVPAIVAVTICVLVTGAFHEDGLADTADGLGGGGDPQRRLAIMKDSRIGTYGAAALGLCLALRIAALASIEPVAAALVFVTAHGGGRAAATWVMASQTHVTEPDGAKYKPAPQGVRLWEAGLATAFAIWPLLFLPAAGLAGAAVGAGLALGLALLARRLIGGYTGDVLGGVEQLFETGFLLGAAAVLS